MRIAIASCRNMPTEFADDAAVRDALLLRGADEVVIEPWDADLDWGWFDVVAVRSTWDYTERLERFLEWADSVGQRLHNSPAVLRWNSDKRYLADLEAVGLPVVSTTFLAPGDEWKVVDAAEFIVKPSVSGGGRDTGRFSGATAQEAAALAASIQAGGRTAMVQPYLASVDEAGETALVFIDGVHSHTLRKKAVLRPDEVAPVRPGDIGAAEAMYDPELVLAGEAADDEIALADEVVSHLTERFGSAPLYARVDLLRGDVGQPVLLELEVIEPNLYLPQAPHATALIADAIAARA